MKSILIFLIVLPLFTFSQVKKKKFDNSKGYLSLKMEFNSYKDYDFNYGGSVTFGGRFGIVNLGAGALITSLNTKAYVPVFFELSGYDDKHKLSPYISMRIGYGNYNEKVVISRITTLTTGGFYFSPGIGIYFPMGKHGAMLYGSYTRSDFKTQFSGMYAPKNTQYTIEGFGGTIGFKF